jgi:hypothetical protein
MKLEGKDYTFEVHNSISLIAQSSNAQQAEGTAFNVSLVKLFIEKAFKWQIYLLSKVCDLTSNKFGIKHILEFFVDCTTLK